VDIPAVDCVLFADPKQSVVDIVQAAGRAMRPFRGKSFGYIIIPIIVPSDKDFDEFAETTEFKQIARTIAALSTQDDRIAEEFRVVDRGKARTDRIIDFYGDIPDGLQIDAAEFVIKIEARIWDRVGKANWRSFEDARNWVRVQNFGTAREWRKAVNLMKIPADIPSNPNLVYEAKGWAGFSDWLGSGYIPTYRRIYLPFEEARHWARSLHLKSRHEWGEMVLAGRLPDNIPAAASNVYADNGWNGWGDWLGSGSIAPSLKEFRPFDIAREWVHSQDFWTRIKWRDFAKSNNRPDDIPSNPEQVYKGHGWQGWGDWLGTGVVANFNKKFAAFDKAESFARSLGLRSQKEWNIFVASGNLPNDIPTNPQRTYSNKGWITWGDWLGTGAIAKCKMTYLSFIEAREWARSNDLKNISEWKRLAKAGKIPPDIPRHPNDVYSNEGWINWGDWLGTHNIANRNRVFRKFEAPG
jgi:hypothetical protein